MDNLPREIINKIMFFTSHPVAEIFKKEMEIACIQMEEDRELNINCDCCNNLWSECNCICKICHASYSSCRYKCYDGYRLT